MKVSQDLFHITLWLFFFVMGGVIGKYGGLKVVIPIGLILVLLGITIRQFFIDSKKYEEIKEKWQIK